MPGSRYALKSLLRNVYYVFLKICTHRRYFWAISWEELELNFARADSGTIPNSYDLGSWWRDFLVLSNIHTDNLSGFYAQEFIYQVLSIDNHRWNQRLGINWDKSEFRANTNSEIWAESCIVDDFGVMRRCWCPISPEAPESRLHETKKDLLHPVTSE